jgi:hypothetical protein
VSVMEGSSQAAHTGLRCAAVTAITDVEFVFLLSLPRRFGPPFRRVQCELSTSHVGSHVAFVMAADGGECWWWVRWDASHQELVQLQVCNAVDQPGRDDCVLPIGHPGAHSYEL